MRQGLCFMTAIVLLTLGSVSADAAVSYDAPIQSLAKAIAEKIDASGKKTAVVIDFTDLQGNTNDLGRWVAEEITAELQNRVASFQVLDRTLFRGALKASRFSMPDTLTPDAVKKIGQAANVDVLITGVVTPLGDTLRISCRIIDADTARVIGSFRGDLNRTKALDTLLAGNAEPGVKPAQEPSEKSATIAASRPPSTPPVSEGASLPPAGPGEGPKSAAVVKQARHKAQVASFVLEFERCKAAGTQTLCTLSVVNTLQKAKRLARCKATLTDDKGQIYRSKGYATFGEEPSSFWADIHPGEPRRMVHTFENIPAETQGADLVLDCAYLDGKATFSKIQMTK